MEFRQDNLQKSNPEQLPRISLTRQEPVAAGNKVSPSSTQTVESGSTDSPVLSERNLFEGGADDVVKGIILAEILGKPLSRRNRS